MTTVGPINVEDDEAAHCASIEVWVGWHASASTHQACPLDSCVCWYTRGCESLSLGAQWEAQSEVTCLYSCSKEIRISSIVYYNLMIVTAVAFVLIGDIFDYRRHLFVRQIFGTYLSPSSGPCSESTRRGPGAKHPSSEALYPDEAHLPNLAPRNPW